MTKEGRNNTGDRGARWVETKDEGETKGDREALTHGGET